MGNNRVLVLPIAFLGGPADDDTNQDLSSQHRKASHGGAARITIARRSVARGNIMALAAATNNKDGQDCFLAIIVNVSDSSNL